MQKKYKTLNIPKWTRKTVERDKINTHNYITFLALYMHFSKKSLKIPKGQSESVYRRRTDNTMAKRKSTKGQTMIYKTYI
jgi:hypothetical protein